MRSGTTDLSDLEVLQWGPTPNPDTFTWRHRTSSLYITGLSMENFNKNPSGEEPTLIEGVTGGMQAIPIQLLLPTFQPSEVWEASQPFFSIREILHTSKWATAVARMEAWQHYTTQVTSPLPFSVLSIAAACILASLGLQEAPENFLPRKTCVQIAVFLCRLRRTNPGLWTHPMPSQIQVDSWIWWRIAHTLLGIPPELSLTTIRT